MITKLSITACFAVALAALALTQPPTLQAQHIRLIDGDTIKWRGERYRLQGWDAPETRPGQFKCIGERRKGDRATAALRQLIDGAEHLQLAGISRQKDFFGRHLATLYADGADAGEVLASQGLAKPSPDGRQQDWCTFVHQRD